MDSARHCGTSILPGSYPGNRGSIMGKRLTLNRWLPIVLAFCVAACSQDRAALVDRESTGSHVPSSPKTGLLPLAGQRAGEERNDNGLKMKFAWCPSGEFLMGSPDSDQDAASDEKPQVAVTLTAGFWLGKHEVTQGEWERVMKTMAWRFGEYVTRGSAYGATYLSWEDALAFCRKLTEMERKAGRLADGWEYTLPTEAQWEYACRAGTTTTYSFGENKSLLSEYAWWGGLLGEGNARKAQCPDHVGRHQPNPWGFYDMHGNVLEWCADVMIDKLPGGADPLVTTGGTSRICRGGSWNLPAERCRSADRVWYDPTFRDYSVGFRVACCPKKASELAAIPDQSAAK
jgi:formylglycine-generating enzyme required for sulfatase activity